MGRFFRSLLEERGRGVVMSLYCASLIAYSMTLQSAAISFYGFGDAYTSIHVVEGSSVNPFNCRRSQ